MRPILFLDDDKHRHQVIRPHLLHDAAYTTQEAIEKLKTKEYDLVFLDHDLNGNQMVDSFSEEETGYTVAKWIVDNKPKIPIIVVHSLNPFGVENMVNLLTKAGYTAGGIPFSVLPTVIDQILESVSPTVEAYREKNSSTGDEPQHS